VLVVSGKSRLFPVALHSLVKMAGSLLCGSPSLQKVGDALPYDGTRHSGRVVYHECRLLDNFHAFVNETQGKR